MKEKLLALLKTKFPGVDNATLERIAAKRVENVTDEAQLPAIVEGIGFQDVLQSYGDYRAGDAAQTAVRNYEKKHGLKDGMKVDDGGAPYPKTEPAPKPAGDVDQVPSWAQAIIDSNKSLAERLNKMDSERTTATRKQQLSTIIEKLPENIRKAYERTPVDGLTDEQFNTLVGEITTEVDGIAGAIQAKGAVFGRPSVQGGTGNQGGELSKEQQEAIAHRDEKPANGQPF